MKRQESLLVGNSLVKRLLLQESRNGGTPKRRDRTPNKRPPQCHPTMEDRDPLGDRRYDSISKTWRHGFGKGKEAEPPMGSLVYQRIREDRGLVYKSGETYV